MIPKLGYVVNALRSHTVHVASVVVAPALLALLLLAELWGIPLRARP